MLERPAETVDPRAWSEDHGVVLEITERVRVDPETFIAILRLEPTIRVHVDGRELPDDERVALLRKHKYLP